jgi:prepilin-type processing-associated H-X9-DG protein
MIAPYVKNKQVFQCPSNRYVGPSYVGNFYLLRVPNDIHDLKQTPTFMSMVQAPSETLLALEEGRDISSWHLGLNRPGTSPYDSAECQIGFNQPLVPLGPGYGGKDGDNWMRYPPHLGGANFILADGHAKWFNTSTMSCSGCVANQPCPAPKWYQCPGGDTQAPKEPKYWQGVTWSPGTGVVKTLWGWSR